MTNISVPYTFYCIDSDYGNNYFYIEESESLPITKIEISGGNYSTTSLISAIQDELDKIFSNLTITMNSLTYKVNIENTSNDSNYTFIFYDKEDGISESKVNNNLGWILGFRGIDVNEVSIEYTLEAGNSLLSESMCFIPHTKYFIVTIEDNNKEQTNKGLVQIGDDNAFIKPTQHYKNSTIGGIETCLTEDNIEDYIDNNANHTNNLFSDLVDVGTNAINDTISESLANVVSDVASGVYDDVTNISSGVETTLTNVLDSNTSSSTSQMIDNVTTQLNRVSSTRGKSTNDNLTKKEIYSIHAIQQSKTKNVVINKDNVNTTIVNDVFAIIPFEDKSLTWGQTTFTSDKNRFQRNYTKPVNIEKLTIKLLDDRGNIVNLNGAEWSFSMMSTHLYER